MMIKKRDNMILLSTRESDDRRHARSRLGKGRRTRAVTAFFKARPAALRMCIWELSLTSSDESIIMYAGYMYGVYTIRYDDPNDG
jgi:hypothetical protein